MLAKVIPNHRSRRDQQSDFSARVAYPCRTAEAVELANLAGTWRDAAFQMRTTAGLAPYMHNPSYHIVLTFGDGEHPSDREIFDAGHCAIEALGGSEHQYILAVHRNRINIHLHIVCNRVHPTSGQVLSTGHDYARLELACRKIEMQNGWPQDRGRFDCRIVDDEMHLLPKPREHWERKTEARKLGLRPDGRAVRRQEQRTALPPLRDFLLSTDIEKLRSAIVAATSWNDVHRLLADASLQYMRHGSGARISRGNGTFFMPAGQVGTSCTMISLKTRLGPFVANERAEKTARVEAVEPAPARPAPNLSPFEAMVQAFARRVKDIRIWRHGRSAAREALRGRHTNEKLQVRELLGGRRTPAAQALRRVMSTVHREQTAELRAQLPPPHPLPLDAASHFAQGAPAEMHRRRYRHVHRASPMIVNSGLEKREPDHTDCRQSWNLAKAKAVRGMPDRIALLIQRHPDDIRIDRFGHLLFARRNAAGSITGFETCRANDLRARLPRPAGSGDGLCLIGSRAAASCVIAPDAITGLARASARVDHEELIVVTGKDMAFREVGYLQELLQGRQRTHELESVLASLEQAPRHTGDAHRDDGNVVGPRGNDATNATQDTDDPSIHETPKPY